MNSYYILVIKVAHVIKEVNVTEIDFKKMANSYYNLVIKEVIAMREMNVTGI